MLIDPIGMGFDAVGFVSALQIKKYIIYIYYIYIYGGFLKWWYPPNTPKWWFLVGKPMVVGYHHFRKPTYKTPFFWGGSYMDPSPCWLNISWIFCAQDAIYKMCLEFRSSVMIGLLRSCVMCQVSMYFSLSQMLNVWYIYLHLAKRYSKCRYKGHTLRIWVCVGFKHVFISTVFVKASRK